MIDIRLPNITSKDPTAQMGEMRSYLYQMVEQLNWALNTLETGAVSVSGNNAVITPASGANSAGNMSADVLENFGALKALIIKTADDAQADIDRLNAAIQSIEVGNRSIESVTESYYRSTSATELIGGSWSNIYPGWVQGTYIWTKSTVTYTDGSSPTVTTPICVSGSQGATGDTGAKGETGDTGETGVGIASCDVEYRLSDSGTELTGNYAWETSILSIPENTYLWTRTKVVYTDGNTAFSGEYCISKTNKDMVVQYADEKFEEYNGLYLAKSDFGEFQEANKQILSIDPSRITQSFTDIQRLQTDYTSIIADISANLKYGALYEDSNGLPVYGVEIGQKTKVNGEEVFNKFARFTSGRLSFYDQNGDEVSYFSDYKMYITNAVIIGDLYVGKYVMDTSVGIAFKWIGG